MVRYFMCIFPTVTSRLKKTVITKVASNMQYLSWPLEAASERQSVHRDSVKMPDFKGTIHVYRLILKNCFDFHILFTPS